MKISETYNLKALYPELAQQWHPTKNVTLTPDKVAPYSQKRVWWICDKGHEWEAIICWRSSGSNSCPYCSGRYASEEYNLSVLHPELAKEWHPFLNGKLKPDMVTPRYDRKVWWVCDKEHEWLARVYNRTKGNGCPYCSGRKAFKDHNLLKKYPEIAKQWHPSKNGGLSPENVTPASGRKVWWICDKGHEWRAVISSRKKNGCPYCCGRKPSKEYNLSVVRPELAKQWHPFRNGYLTPEKVTHGSRKKVWWLCDKGHEWQAIIQGRCKGTGGCPRCSRERIKHNSPGLGPVLIRQWHPTKNLDLKPDNVTPGSERKVWWICDKGHEWLSSVYNRTRGTGCPYCAGRKASKDHNLLKKYPDIAKQWHPTKNPGLTPDKVTPRSDRKVWWVCDKGHEWLSSVYNRAKSKGCPYCAGKKASKDHNLLKKYPDIAKQWHPTKNPGLTPDKVTPRSDRKVWWICDKGHEWLSSVSHRTKPRGCPHCARKKRRRKKKKHK